MKRSVSLLLGLFALALAFGLTLPLGSAVTVDSLSPAFADAASGNDHSGHRHADSPEDSCATSASQSCTPLIAQLRDWTLIHVLPEATSSMPGSDQHASSPAPKPDIPPPRA